MKKNLSYFMKESKEEIVTVPAPETFKDENGNPVEMEIKLLSHEQIRNIEEKYRRRAVYIDKKGNPFISNGEVAMKYDYDANKALRHIMTEALVYPDLKSKEMMDFYKCHDITEMPFKVFTKPSDYDYVFRTVMTTLGIMYGNKDEEENPVEQAKN